MLSESERRRFDQIAAELRQDDALGRLDDGTSRRTSARSRTVPNRRRALLEWAEHRFAERIRRGRTR